MGVDIIYVRKIGLESDKRLELASGVDVFTDGLSSLNNERTHLQSA